MAYCNENILLGRHETDRDNSSRSIVSHWGDSSQRTTSSSCRHRTKAHAHELQVTYYVSAHVSFITFQLFIVGYCNCSKNVIHESPQISFAFLVRTSLVRVGLMDAISRRDRVSTWKKINGWNKKLEFLAKFSHASFVVGDRKFLSPSTTMQKKSTLSIVNKCHTF